MIKHQILTWNFSGGELFEHPQILDALKMIEEYWTKSKIKCPLTFATNGRELVRNKEIYHAVENLQKKHGKRCIIIQVTDDKRYYPDPLSQKEKYWLSKLNAIIDTVPSDPSDKFKILYPQGRALINHPDANWNTIVPKCSNCILIAKQIFSGPEPTTIFVPSALILMRPFTTRLTDDISSPCSYIMVSFIT